jgi:hypothetical protein
MKHMQRMKNTTSVSTMYFRCMLHMFHLDVSKADLLLHICCNGYMYVASVCFKCFSSFKRMLQVFYWMLHMLQWLYTYVASVCLKCFCCFQTYVASILSRYDVAYVALAIHVCCKCTFQMFELFQTYVANVLCFKCFYYF